MMTMAIGLKIMEICSLTRIEWCIYMHDLKISKPLLLVLFEDCQTL